MTEEVYLLNIHTTGEIAIVSLSKGKNVLGTKYNDEFKAHAAFLHLAIEGLFSENKITPAALKAISVTHGPGSYTGIRVGMATAKGLCYALNIPLITLNTLDVMALSAIHNVNDPLGLYCPMIDARRMEVYTAIYGFNQGRLSEPHAVVIDHSFYENYVQSKKVYFFGSGSMKFEKLLGEARDISKYIFKEIEINSEAMAELSDEKYSNNQFSDVAYSEPEYLKEFKLTTIK